MEDIVVGEEKVLKHFAKLKVDKSPGLDKLHPRLLKKKHLVYSSISQLIENHYIMTEEKAQISAIVKTSQAQNYRSVSLTSVICKTLERIIRDHLIDHIDKIKLFSDKQYGFIKRRSTILQILEVLDKWTEAIDDGLEVDTD